MGLQLEKFTKKSGRKLKNRPKQFEGLK